MSTHQHVCDVAEAMGTRADTRRNVAVQIATDTRAQRQSIWEQAKQLRMRDIKARMQALRANQQQQHGSAQERLAILRELAAHEGDTAPHITKASK